MRIDLVYTHMQAAYGQSTLTITSFFTYVGLGLGFLGSSLALPFGLYVLICQRTTEKYVQVMYQTDVSSLIGSRSPASDAFSQQACRLCKAMQCISEHPTALCGMTFSDIQCDSNAHCNEFAQPLLFLSVCLNKHCAAPLLVFCAETVDWHLQDKITPAAGGRQTALAVLIVTSILILLPMLPSGTDAAAVTTGTFL